MTDAFKHAILGSHESLLSELVRAGSRVRSTMAQMPAMNTPQVDWAKSRLRRQTQPVPPIFRPEVGADAVRHAWLALAPHAGVALGTTGSHEQ